MLLNVAFLRMIDCDLEAITRESKPVRPLVSAQIRVGSLQDY